MADTTILSWITAEVDQALERVRRQLAAYRSEPSDAAALAACPEHLHQVSGALNMVGLAGATRFCDVLETSLTGVNAAGAEGVSVLDRAVLELKQFVDDVARGQPNVPTRLYPVYRQLAHLQGREDVSEIELFFPDLTLPAPSHPRPLALEDADLPAFLQSQRTRWQRGILAWIRRQPQGLEEMRETLDAIHSVAHQLPERRALWWVASGLVDALLDVSEPQRLAHGRSLCNKIDLHIRDLAARKEPAPDNEPLLRELLYAVACSPPLSQRLRDIKRFYGLDALVPGQGQRAPDVDTLQPVLEEVRSRLQAAQQTWQQYLEGEPNSMAGFRARVEALRERASDLRHAPFASLLEALADAASRLPDVRPLESDAMLAEMASAFLLAESILETFAHPAADVEEQVAIMSRWLADAASTGGKTAAPTGLRTELTQYVNALQLRSQVAKEILANLQQAEQGLDAYARGQAASEALQAAALQLRQIHGALSVLGWERAIAVLERCERLVEGLAPGSEDIDWVAEGLSSLGFFIAPCVHGREPRQAAVDLFLERVGQRASRATAAPAAPRPAPSDELLQVFLEEAVEVLSAIEAGLAVCRAEPAKLEALAAIRRGFHTLKGSGRMVGLAELGEAAWEAERVLNQWLEQKQAASPELLDLVAVAHGRFTAWIEELRNGEPLVVDARPISEMAAQLRGQEGPAARVLDIYLKEAAGHTATLKREYAAWTQKRGGDASPEFMRAAHTLASSSRTAGFADIASLAAALEQWVPLAPRTTEEPDSLVISRCIEALEASVAAAGRGEARAGVEEAAGALRSLKDRLQVPPRPREKRAMRDDIDDDLLPLFLDEARELLPQMGADLRAWKAAPGDRNAADTVKRALHTLKGSARMAGAIRLGELAHLMESAIDYAVEAGEPTGEVFEDLEGKMDRLSTDLDKLGQGRDAPTPTVQPPQAAPSAAVPPPPPSTPAAMLRVNAERLDRLITEAGEAAIARSRIEAELRQVKQALGELSESIARLRTQLREVEIQADSQLQSRRAVLDAREGDFDPLEFDRYTRLQEVTRMMAEGLSDAASIQQALLKSLGETDAALLQQARISRELQQDLMRMRAVPFATLAERLHRVVRQTGRELGKKAELALQGAQVELDRGVLERIAAPLEHMLRNALAHGIEDPAGRRAAGKPESGRIMLTLRQEANEVILALSDDGAGIDGARLREKALAKGLLGEDQVLSEAEQVQLVFAGGVSTAQSITEVAGRGIGMDVVRNEVNALGGRIEAASTQGRGTTFTIYLPLTLAVTQTLMVRAAGASFAVPSAMVEQVLRLKSDALVASYEKGVIDFQGRDYRLHYLRQLLGGRSATEIRDYNAVLLLRSGAQRVAVHVDELVGSREMVVKNIGPQLARIPGVTGATVMPDAAIVLILNPVQLAPRGTLAGVRTAVPEIGEHGARSAPLVMVVDDSITVRKVTGRLLEREGYRVLTAKDGLDALEQLKGELPAVMLVDIEMPRMDGFDLARNVRGDPRTMDIPIIVVSSRTAPKHRSRAADLGVNAFLGKPYEEAELVRQVAAFVPR